MLEDVEPASERAVAPNVGQVALGAVSLHILDDDALETISPLHDRLHALKTERGPSPLLIVVPDDEDQVAIRGQETAGQVDDPGKSFEKCLRIGIVILTLGILPKTCRMQTFLRQRLDGNQ